MESRQSSVASLYASPFSLSLDRRYYIVKKTF